MAELKSKTRRLGYIDALKGFGIILMVLGHMHFGHNALHQYIFGFHMPLFFLVSGYLYKTPKNLVDSIRQKMKGLLVPYFILGLGYYLFWMFRHLHTGDSLFAPLKAVLWVTVDGLPVESALWFLMVMFWAWLIYALIDRFIKDIWTKTFIIILISVLGCVWCYVLPFRLPWGLQDAFAVQMFFLAGEAYRRLENRRGGFIRSWKNVPDIRKICFLIVGILIDALFICENGFVNIRLGQWPGFILTYVNAILAVWLWMELIRCLMKNRTLRAMPGAIFERIGKFSIVWLCINHPVIRLAKLISNAIFVNARYPLIKQTVIVVLALVFLYVIAELLMNTPARVILRKWKDRKILHPESN
ncbi:MAG: acyltransferase family protein [Lachnospiraceae bacterium]|nr:acyltransferase family protein [Lachnospiraceae bacterium]